MYVYTCMYTYTYMYIHIHIWKDIYQLLRVTELIFEPGDWAHIHAHFTVCHCLFVLRFFPPSERYHLWPCGTPPPAWLGPPHHSVKFVFIPMYL